jgi:hypothetical protein
MKKLRFKVGNKAFWIFKGDCEIVATSKNKISKAGQDLTDLMGNHDYIVVLLPLKSDFNEYYPVYDEHLDLPKD